MTLVNCVECDARISDKAEACPKCGYPYPFRKSGNCPKCRVKIVLDGMFCPVCAFPIFNEAWDKILLEGDEILLELVAEKVGELCGLKPDLNICRKFIETISIGSDNKESKKESRTRRSPNGLSSQAKGELERKEFVKKLQSKGIKLFRSEKSKVIYRTNRNSLVGIPYANEQQEGGKWVLGLPPERYDHFVFICETSEGKILRFIFSKNFVNRYIDKFSRNKKTDNIIFSVHQEDDSFLLYIPTLDKICIDEYINNISVLKLCP